MGVAFRHRESHLKNFCNKLLKWEWMIDVCFTPESGHFNVAGAYSLLPDDLARDQPVGTAPFGTRSKEILMRCISELKGMVR